MNSSSPSLLYSGYFCSSQGPLRFRILRDWPHLEGREPTAASHSVETFSHSWIEYSNKEVYCTVLSFLLLTGISLCRPRIFAQYAHPSTEPKKVAEACIHRELYGRKGVRNLTWRKEPRAGECMSCYVNSNELLWRYLYFCVSFSWGSAFVEEIHKGRRNGGGSRSLCRFLAERLSSHGPLRSTNEGQTLPVVHGTKKSLLLCPLPTTNCGLALHPASPYNSLRHNYVSGSGHGTKLWYIQNERGWRVESLSVLHHMDRCAHWLCMTFR